MFKFSSQSPSGKKNHNHRFTNIMEWREENHIKINVRFWSWRRGKKKNTWSRSRLGMEARGWNGWRWRWGGQIKRRLEAFVNLFFFFFFCVRAAQPIFFPLLFLLLLNMPLYIFYGFPLLPHLGIGYFWEMQTYAGSQVFQYFFFFFFWLWERKSNWLQLTS